MIFAYYEKCRHSFFYLEYAEREQESELYYNPGKKSKLKVAKPFLVDGTLGEYYNEKRTPQRPIKERIS